MMIKCKPTYSNLSPDNNILKFINCRTLPCNHQSSILNPQSPIPNPQSPILSPFYASRLILLHHPSRASAYFCEQITILSLHGLP